MKALKKGDFITAEVRTQLRLSSKTIAAKGVLSLGSVVLATVVSVCCGQEAEKEKLGITLNTRFISRQRRPVLI